MPEAQSASLAQAEAQKPSRSCTRSKMQAGLTPAQTLASEQTPQVGSRPVEPVEPEVLPALVEPLSPVVEPALEALLLEAAVLAVEPLEAEVLAEPEEAAEEEAVVPAPAPPAAEEEPATGTQTRSEQTCPGWQSALWVQVPAGALSPQPLRSARASRAQVGRRVVA